MADLLKAQYEALPYPHRDPEDERKRVILTQLERIPILNHFVFGGRFDRSRPFRALVAGGGTGDALIALACQLRAARMPAELCYIDLSEASQAVARARAAVHGLDNLRFETGSFLEAGCFEPASFDYINCSGVLHHLPSPEEGLRVLARLLKPQGGIGIMLYGVFGRTGVYPAQELLRAIAPDTLPVPERVRLARKLLDGLPATNWLRRNAAMNEGNENDAEIYDVLLHSRDRAYSVEDVAGLAAAAKMRLVSFLPPAVYRPEHHLQDAELVARLSSLDPVAQAACAEKLCGTFSKHEFYLVHGGNPVAPPDFRDRACIPMFDGFPQIPAAGGQVEIALMEAAFKLKVNLPDAAVRILRLIDGMRPLGAIQNLSDLGDPAFDKTWAELYAFMHGHGYIHLSCQPMPNLQFQPSFQ